MVCLDVALLVLAFQYDASFEEANEEEEEEEDMMMDDKKMGDDMEGMMMEDGPEGMEGGAVETQRSGPRSRAASRSSSMARRRNALNMSHMSNVSAMSGMSKRSVKSAGNVGARSVRSAAAKSVKSVRSNKMNVAAPPVMFKDNLSQRDEKTEALVADKNMTPRSSLKEEQLSYEAGNSF